MADLIAKSIMGDDITTAAITDTPSGTWKLFFPAIIQDYTVVPMPGVIPDGYSSWSTPITKSPSQEFIWVVNPDANSITKISTDDFAVSAEIATPSEPWSLVASPDGTKVYVVARAAKMLAVFDSETHIQLAQIPFGSEPTNIALNPTGSIAYVTLSTADEVAVVDTRSFNIITQIAVDRMPYAIAVTDDGDMEDTDERLYVTHFLGLPHPGGQEAADDGRAGQVTVIDTNNNSVIDTIPLLPDEHGFPNLLAGIAILGNSAWIPQVRAAPALPNSLITTVFAAISVLNLEQGKEDSLAHLPLNDQDIFGSPVNNPVAAVPSPDGNRLYVVLAGSDLIEVIDISNPHTPTLVRFLPVGKNPRGMVVSQDGRQGYVMNYLSRSVTVFDLENLEAVAEIPVATETLDSETLQGKIIFNNATDPRLSQGSWISCASCHPDGDSDSVTWMFPDGPRQTPPIWKATQTLPWHWSAALDEAQDVEETIQIIQHGLGLAPGIDPLQLGSPNAGRSADLDALAAFMEQGIRVSTLPQPTGNVDTGRDLFQIAGCAACHGGPYWTSSMLPGIAGTLDPDNNGMVDSVLRDVGTLNPHDLRGDTGFDPPSLLNVALTAPYFHDGSMPTLTALLNSGHPDPLDQGNGLTATEVADLVVFLRMIGRETVPIEMR